MHLQSKILSHNIFLKKQSKYLCVNPEQIHFWTKVGDAAEGRVWRRRRSGLRICVTRCLAKPPAIPCYPTLLLSRHISIIKLQLPPRCCSTIPPSLPAFTVAYASRFLSDAAEGFAITEPRLFVRAMPFVWRYIISPLHCTSFMTFSLELTHKPS
jgi:hypothetical protein